MHHVTHQDAISVGGAGIIRFLIEAADSNGSASVFEACVPAGSGMPAPHSHDGFEETIYGLEGVSTWTIDGERVEVAPGTAMCIARGRIHWFANDGDRDTRFLAIATPGLFGRSYFEEIGEVIAANAGGPPDQAAIEDVMRRHGLTPAATDDA
jgi:quercetin dioxygenase-like cupin family protein